MHCLVDATYCFRLLPIAPFLQDTKLYEYKIIGLQEDLDPELSAQVYMDWEYRKKWDSYVLGEAEQHSRGKMVEEWGEVGGRVVSVEKGNCDGGFTGVLECSASVRFCLGCVNGGPVLISMLHSVRCSTSSFTSSVV